MTNAAPYNPTMIPGCRWDYRRFLRAQRAAQIAETNRDTIAAYCNQNGIPLEASTEYGEARRDAQRKRERADARRQELLGCLQRMEVTDPDPYVDGQPEMGEPADTPVELPPGVTEQMDEAEYEQPTFAARCGAASKNFERYGYCDRRSSKDGNYCYDHRMA